MSHDSSKEKLNIKNVFSEKQAVSLRKWLIKGIEFKKKGTLPRRSHYIVINPTNFCLVACPNCLYSSINGPKEEFGSLDKVEVDKAVKVMNESENKMVVFSGGGEPIENLSAITDILERVRDLKDAIIITSSYFAQTKSSTEKMLSKITASAWGEREKKGLSPVKLTFRVSYDKDHCRRVPLANIINIVRYAERENNPKFRVLIRTLLAENENVDKKIAAALGSELMPAKDPDDLTNLPVVDGLPCRWMRVGNSGFELPVIYKPLYFIGRVQDHDDPIWSYKRVIESEIKSGTKFNLCLRGPKGEGHNYYETIFRGYNFWEKTGKKVYNTPKNDEEKEIALYLTADSRLIVNSGTPDMFVYIKDVKSWNHFLDHIYQDPVQRALIEKGPFYIKKIAEEVAENLTRDIEKANFVFAIALFSLKTPVLRLYTTIRLIQDFYKKNKIEIKNPSVLKLIQKSNEELQDLFAEQKSNSNRQDMKDPIIGEEKGIFYTELKSITINNN